SVGRARCRPVGSRAHVRIGPPGPEDDPGPHRPTTGRLSLVEDARRAVPDDLSDIVRLAREGHAELRPNRGGAIWAVREGRHEPTDDAVRAAVEGEPGLPAVVGLVDDVVVGYGTMHLETLHDGSSLAVVTDLFVTEPARGIGVGEAMMNLLIAEAEA